jgi:hypothetical protein
MKLLMILLAFMPCAKASVLVDHRPQGWLRFDSVRYAVSPDANRAWLNIIYSNLSCDPAQLGSCASTVEVSVAVPGLAFDPATNQIAYKEAATAPVVCAKFARHWYANQVTPTGGCEAKSMSSLVVLDDGFDRSEVKFIDVYFGRALP